MSDVDHDDAVRRPDRFRDFERVAVLVSRVVDQVEYRAPSRYLKETGFLGGCPVDLPTVAGVGVAPSAQVLDAQEQRLRYHRRLFEERSLGNAGRYVARAKFLRLTGLLITQ